VVLVLKTWQCTGIGYTTPAEADLAMAAAARTRNTNHGLFPPPDHSSINRRRSDVPVKLQTDCLWTVEGTAHYLRVPEATLYQWRYLGVGPKSGGVGRHVRYDPAGVIAWFRHQQEVAA
jgi:Helix-turn-helix domain